MGASILQCEMTFASHQLHPQFIELEAHSASAVDELGQKLDDVGFGELRATDRVEFFANTFHRGFTQRGPQVVRECNNTTRCNSRGANHLQMGWLFACESLRGRAGDVVGHHGKVRTNFVWPVRRHQQQSNLKLAARESMDFGNNGEARRIERTRPSRRFGRLHAKP